MSDEKDHYICEKRKLYRVSLILETLEKKALRYYYGKHGTKEAERLSRMEANTGTFAHSYIKSFFTGEVFRDWDTVQQEKYFSSVRNFHEFEEKFDLRPVFIEKTVYSLKYSFAGTFDGLFWIGKRLVLLDWKTSSGIWDSYQLQLVAYRVALTELIKRGKIKDVTLEDVARMKLWVVRLDKKSKKFKFKRDVKAVKYNKKILSAFLGLLSLFNWVMDKEK
jgi:hypothetical protein